MASSSFFVLTIFAVIAAGLSAVDAFSPVPTCHTSRRHISTPLFMGMFDSFQKAFGNEEYGAPPDAVKANARHILVPTLEDANTVLGEIAKGESNFSSIAAKYSTCPSKSSGGSLGSFGPGTMVKEFDEVVFNPKTKVGQIMGPIQTQFGYHLIVVDKRKGGGDWY